MRRKRTTPAWRKALLLVPLNLAAFLATGEIGLRLAGPVYLARRMSVDAFNREVVAPPPRLPGTPLRPNARGRTYGHQVRTNSLGFRGPEVAPPRPGTVRVAVLGRSVAFGWGVAQRQAWPFVMERLLAAQGVSAQVVNLSVPAWTLADIYVAAHRFLTRLKPKVLLLPIHPEDFYFLDALLGDLQKNAARAAHPAAAPTFLQRLEGRFQAFLASPAGSGLFLKEFLASTWLRLQLALKKRKAEYGAQAPARLGRGALFLVQVLEDLQGLAKKWGARMIVLDMGGSEPLGEFCRMKGIGYVQARLKGAPSRRPLTLGLGDPHPNPLGHRWIARRAAGAVLEALGRKR